ncbi:hypothetical protein [Noviherbaspirillum galbum]|uniref:Uncharacterized protein n=1 Tax=Noviherbaspirillum galbum TaxID=2709383 RepID=A0A6B3SHT9_9BURK|nr:hypothetical protein [Noviherbaspirillum galbum]NEX60230.1 hypothetical protein [Noviherbaspirillum galbum]
MYLPVEDRSQDRSSRPETRNPLLKLPAAARLAALPPESKAALRELLLELKAHCRENAEKCWRSHKPPMAMYWKAMGVWIGHCARLLR